MPFAAIQQALPDAAELDRAVRAVLARPEFAERELPSLLQWLVDLYTAARRAVWRMIADLDGLSESAPVFFWILVGWLAISLVALLVHLGITAAQAWRARDRSHGPTEAGDVSGEREARPVTDWEARAEEEAAEGRLREAALALYRAVLLRLHEREALSYDPCKTPGDYRRETAGDADARGVLHSFLRRFEPIAFGGRSVTLEAYEGLAMAAREAGARV